MDLNFKKIKPTFDNPQSDHAKSYQRQFDKTMRKQGVFLENVDNVLNEKEQSLKKKIFNLSKMEALVFSDPKLTAVYNKMSKDGEEKYGYHYNETIMNMIFNDYVLNSPKYLQKYKASVPKEKKRRDKSGIEALKKSGKEKMKATGTNIIEPKEKESVNETTASTASGAFSTKAGSKENFEANQIDTEKEWNSLNNPEVSEIAKEKKMKDKKKSKTKPVDKNNLVGGSSAKPSYPGGKVVKNPNNNLNESVVHDLDTAKEIANKTSREEGVVQHVNVASNGKYLVSDWYDDDSTVASFENGMQINEDQVEETTGASSSGAYVGPAMWGGGDLMKGGEKQEKDKESFWKGGKVIGESNYLIETNGFEKYYDMLDEQGDGDKIKTVEELKSHLSRMGRKKVMKEDIPLLAGEALYQIAIKLANSLLPLSWDDLADINSMWDYIDKNGGMSFEELKRVVKEAVDDRLAEEGYNLDDLMERTELWEHHAQNRDEKIEFILKYLNRDGQKYSKEDFEEKSDIAIDQTYRDVEKLMGIAEQNMDEHHLDTREQKIKFIASNMEGTMPMEVLQDMPDEDIDTLYQELEGEMGLYESEEETREIVGLDKLAGKLEMTGDLTKEDLIKVAEQNNMNPMNLIALLVLRSVKGAALNEKAKSKAQQKFMGMVHALKKGELDPSDVSGDVEKAADSISDKEAEKFASTKHKGLPQKVDEEPEEISASQIYYDEIKKGKTEEEAAETILDIVTGGMWAAWDGENIEQAKQKIMDKFKNKPNESTKVNSVGGVAMHDSEENNIREDSQTMIDNKEDTMAMKPPYDKSQGGVEMGMQSTGPMSEDFEKINKELALYEMHHKRLKDMDEEKRPSSLILKDRLGKDNEKNFKQDLKHSGTKDIIDTTKELEWKDQQTDVGKDPQKLGKDIEKEMIKNTDGDSFENVGNSTNNDGDEIPKRNLTDDEADEVDLYRKGLGDFVYDNEPDKRYMERMKRDMGEEEYKKREARMKFNADAPMYNKDTQPVDDDSLEKDQFDKAKSTWNDRMGLKESTLTGKYVDEMGKTRFFDFSTLNVREVKDSKKDAFFKVNLDGLGNTYNNKVQMLEGVSNAINEWDFYTDGKEVFVEKRVQNLNENEQKKETRPVNEQFDKMKHLLGYDPKNFVDTKKNKI